MPLLGGLLVTIFGGLANYLLVLFTARIAAAVAAAATFSLLVVGLYVSVGLLVAALTFAFPPVVLTGVWLFVPDNAVLCLAVIFGVDTLVALFRWNVGGLRVLTGT